MPTKAGREAWGVLSDLMFNGEMRDRFHEASAEIGVSPGLLKGLFYLDEREGVPMRDLADHFQCDASYMTGLVDGLEERGFAERRPHPTDRRVKAVVLTKRGANAKAKAMAVLYEPPTALNALSATEQRQLRDLICKIAAADPELDDASLTSGASRKSR